jgi:branched-chain amino acid transport system permease protein
MVNHAEAAPARSVRLEVAWARYGRYVGRGVLFAAAAFALIWVLFLAENAAVEDPKLFRLILWNSITLAGLYFVVASGFTLIFGLMRVVNMAHGTLFLLGGYIAFEVQKKWEDAGSWGLGLLISVLGIGAIGLLMQQAFLRWNQGQDLRQAMITIAISIILVDQMLGSFGGVPKDLKWPPQVDFQVSPPVIGQYAFVRIFILLCAVAVGVMLWLWLKKTRTGMVIRAGVDDRAMVSALGINIQLTFAIAFAVGSALAGFGGVLGGSFGGLQPVIVDSQWLLNSLIVVIIGGMGSLGGAAVGALLYAVVDSFADIYLPGDYRNYSVLLTFALLVAVLAWRPLGLFGRPA